MNIFTKNLMYLNIDCNRFQKESICEKTYSEIKNKYLKLYIHNYIVQYDLFLNSVNSTLKITKYTKIF